MISKNNNQNTELERLQKELKESQDDVEAERKARKELEKENANLIRQLQETKEKLETEIKSHENTREDASQITLRLQTTQDQLKSERTKHLEELYRAEKLNHALMEALDNANTQSETKINKLNKKLNKANEIITDSHVFSRHINENNSKYEGSTFGLAMRLKGSDYNNGDLLSTKIDPHQVIDESEPEITYTLTAIKDEEKFLNSTAVKIDLASPNIAGDKLQQFIFSSDGNDSVIRSVADGNLAFTVSGGSGPNSGSPFCLSPFAGTNNQEFVFKKNRLFSKQDGKCVTYIGGNVPFVMMDPSDELETRQTFILVLF